jgi:2,4-dienoyl-CoA reductase-like NADH-dependent reductase (Old Yellow Enzyme family)
MNIAGVDLNIENVSLTTPVESRPLLFQPLTIRGLTLRNRVMFPPMSQYMSRAETSAPNDWHLVHLGQFAMGGAGLVFCEETSVEARGRRTYNCAGIYTDVQVAAWKRVTSFIHDLGAASAIQLGHGGDRGSIRSPWEGRAPLTEADAARGQGPWEMVSSTSSVGRGGQVTVALDEAEIRNVIANYADAAKRSADAGFDVAEIHGAHGYLLMQFLSPNFNTRTDGYGGDLAGRMRLTLEVAEAVRAAWPADRPLFFRISAVDAAGGAWDIDDSVVLSRELKARGVDVIDCSSGSGNGQSAPPEALVPRVRGYHVPYAEHLRRETGMMTVASGNIIDAAQAEAILAAGQADIVAVGRAMMVDPYWTVHAAKELGLADWLATLPPQYAFRLFERDVEWERWPEDKNFPLPFRRAPQG